MSKFINTSYKNTINSIVETHKSKIDNPYYIFTDKKPTLVTYYNQNLHKSTLDEGTHMMYEPIGDESPVRFNKILDMYIYGIERITVNLDLGEYGLESDAIEGEAYILPNTIEPLEQDYFCIDYIDTKKTKLLFKILTVTPDTVNNGANFYKITYKLSTLSKESIADIERQVIETYRMVINNIGTQFNAVIKNTDYDLIVSLEENLDRLKEYYKALFFKDKVQTFVFDYDDEKFYDPYMIEFLIKHSILSGTDKYTHVSHQTSLGQTFALDYDRTFFRGLETKNIKKMNNIACYARLNTDKLTLMYHRPERYYIMQYRNEGSHMAHQINPLPVGFEVHLANRTYYKDDKEYLNIIIDYFYNKEFNSATIDILERVDYSHCIHMYYAIPIIIYIIEDTIRSIMLDKNNI